MLAEDRLLSCSNQEVSRASVRFQDALMESPAESFRLSIDFTPVRISWRVALQKSENRNGKDGDF